eukprot:3418094-Rhodomonas_salina.1
MWRRQQRSARDPSAPSSRSARPLHPSPSPSAALQSRVVRAEGQRVRVEGLSAGRCGVRWRVQSGRCATRYAPLPRYPQYAAPGTESAYGGTRCPVLRARMAVRGAWY